jgi:polyphosphate kinase
MKTDIRTTEETDGRPERVNQITPDSPEAYLNREISWLNFARRVLALVEDGELPVLERVKFAGIMGMLHDEFFMKRMSGLKAQLRKGVNKKSLDGRTPREEFESCRRELLEQTETLSRVIKNEILPQLEQQGIPIVAYDALSPDESSRLRDYFRESVLPILTPLAVDVEHPFPFISNHGLNLAVLIKDEKSPGERFVRVKVPENRPRWVRLPDNEGFVPLEQLIAANLDLVFPDAQIKSTHIFRVTRGAEGEPEPNGGADVDVEDIMKEPGSIVRQVTNELKARRFAGVVRLQIDPDMPKRRLKWIANHLAIDNEDIYPAGLIIRLSDLLSFRVTGREGLRVAAHTPVTHQRFRHLDPHDTGAVFDEIRDGDILLHHPYHSFDTSVLRFLESAAADPSTLAIKITIYRTSSDSPIVRALVDAVRRGKQVAVLVEITARFDEAPNIAWGQYLENEGVHVSYGVERLKTHVKLALVIREEQGSLRRYVHVGTGNYHTGTARVYEDLGLLTCDPDICADAAAVFNVLTGAIPHPAYRKLIVAPVYMRDRFTSLIRREAEHARAGRPSGIRAKMNQLQDSGIIRELYVAGQAGVPITLHVRGLCCLRPGVPGLSETIRVVAVVSRFLEHSRIFEFRNGGDVEYYIGSADWMRRNLDRRVETITPVEVPRIKQELCEILDVYDNDNTTAWDCKPDGVYARRTPGEGDVRRAAQESFIQLATDAV